MQTFSSDGVSIAFIDEPGAGEPAEGKPPVVLVHGFASNHAVNWVNTAWVKTLVAAGYRVIALDNRGHGRSEKLYDPERYNTALMARDVRNLLDHLDIARAVVMGYSMGARITAFTARDFPDRVAAAILGGLGHRLVEGVGLPSGIASAMEAESVEDLTDPMQRMFRAFAEQTGSDLRALAACIRGTRQTLEASEVAAIDLPVLVAVGTKDDIAGDGPRLAGLFPQGEALDIPGRDHNLAVGDKVHKQGVLNFLKNLG